MYPVEPDSYVLLMEALFGVDHGNARAELTIQRGNHVGLNWLRQTCLERLHARQHVQAIGA